MRQATPAILLLALLVGLPMAGAEVSIPEVRVPDRTAADRPFEVHVRLVNEGPARDVHLFGALYAYEEGKAPCGPATDPSFRAFTHVAQETVRLPANGAIEHPPAGERWLHRYGTEDAGPSPSLEELCIFVADASGGPVIEYEAYASTRLSVRAVNAPPQPSFAWEPERPVASQDVRFTAQAVDAEGDPVTFTWDFGRFDAAGRARGEGERVTHAFYPAGEFVVTLTASDGIDEAPVTRTIAIGEGEPDRPSRDLLPLAPWLALAALVGVAAAFRRR